MDTLHGRFDPDNSSEELNDFDAGEVEGAPVEPPSPIGQDERRMQVRAYNHWASLLGDNNFPSIEDLDLETLDDFGPHSVLLDFSLGVEDPHVRFVGKQLAVECDAPQGIERLADVPSRSLLSRITDHYMQILANQAPIGFEAEFVNQRERTILYRGILLPYSSDNDTIDFILGVINWKEVADQKETDELMLEIDQALESRPEDEAGREGDNVLDLANYTSTGPDEQEPGDSEVEESADAEPDERLLRPTFGSLLNPQGYDDEDDEDEDDDGFSLPADWRLSDPTAETDGDFADDKADVFDEDFDPETQGEDDGPELGLARLIESEFERAERGDRKPIDLASLDIGDDAIDPDEHGIEPPEFAHGAFDPAADGAAFPTVEVSDNAFDDGPLDERAIAPSVPDEGEVSHFAEDRMDAFAEVDMFDEGEGDADEDIPLEPSDTAAGLYDCLADARELAQAAQHSEDRSRTALYAAVGRAYDVSLAAQDAAADFAELLEENGLAVQDRAPMTPIVKLVFGADYDKTRLTEYAAVLSHAHRIGIARGKLGSYLADADGGLKGVVKEERRLRREESGKQVEPRNAVRASLAKKLRAIDGFDPGDIEAEGQEFALLLIRRTTEGDIVVLGEIDRDIPLLERTARKIVA